MKNYYVIENKEPARASVGETIRVRMENDAILQRVSRDLYASAASGVRELLANEIRAAQTARDEGADPSIHVTIQDGRLIIQGINSLGMERRIFDEVYCTLGRSSNFDGKTPGQFGLGRAAYMTISDNMLLETKHRNGDCYAVLGLQGMEYQTGFNPPDIPYGTRVSMAIRKGSHIHDMITMVEKIAAMSDIPITLTTETGVRECTMNPVIDGTEPIHADIDDVEFAVAEDGDTRAYLCGMPIYFTYRGKYSGKMHIHIKDERKYTPLPNRENMTKETEYKISNMIDHAIQDWFRDYPVKFAEIMQRKDKQLAFKIGDQQMFPWLYDTVTTSKRTWYDGDKRSIHTTRWRGITGYPVLSCNKFNGAQINAVLERFPNAEFVRDVDTMPTIGSFIKENSIQVDKPKKRVKHNDGRIVVYDGHKAERVSRRYARHNTYNVPQIKKALSEWGPGMNNVNFTLDKSMPSLEDAIETALADEYITSKGTMTGAEIVRYNGDVAWTDKHDLVEMWGDGMKADIPQNEDISYWRDQTQILVVISDNLSNLLGMVANVKFDKSINWFKMSGWTYQSIMTYLRLKKPFHKYLMLHTLENRTPHFCDYVAELEGFEPVQHERYCSCAACQDR